MATEKQRQTALRNLEKARQAQAALRGSREIPRQHEGNAGGERHTSDSDDEATSDT